jgi:putative membrane protein
MIVVIASAAKQPRTARGRALDCRGALRALRNDEPGFQQGIACSNLGRSGRTKGESPMIAEAVAAYAHFLSIFALLALLAAEAALYRRRMAEATLMLLRRLDAGYALAAVAVIVTGLLRVFFFAKGPEFYAVNPVFWVKMALFVTVALMSIPPTLHYIRTAKASRGGGIDIPERTYRHIRGHLWGQLALFALIPLAATLMARGVGM